MSQCTNLSHSQTFYNKTALCILSCGNKMCDCVACGDKQYGVNCKNNCHCRENVTCNPVNGFCPPGGLCDPDWGSSGCQIRQLISHYILIRHTIDRWFITGPASAPVLRLRIESNLTILRRVAIWRRDNGICHIYEVVLRVGDATALKIG